MDMFPLAELRSSPQQVLVTPSAQADAYPALLAAPAPREGPVEASSPPLASCNLLPPPAAYGHLG